MKRTLSILSIFLIAAFVVACNNSKPDVATIVKQYQDSVKLSSDTAGLAQFQAWKAQNELMPEEQQPMASQEAAYSNAAPQRRSYSTTRSSSASRSRNTSASRSSTGSTASTTTRKKGWSKAAKGAVIGGAGGAVAGAVINKRNRAVGAVVGGIIGAGGGYVIGRNGDKRDGRY